MTTSLNKDNIITGQQELQTRVSKENLLKAITTVSGAVSSKAALPILSNILIESTGPNKIVLTATDLELGIRSVCEATVQLQGSVTIPAKKLYEIIREVQAGEIEVTVNRNHAVNVKTGKSFFKIMGLGGEDFPKLPEISGEEAFEIDAQILRDSLALTSFAISRDETRYTLNGVLFILNNKLSRFVATDGKRMSCVQYQTDVQNSISVEVIIPTKTVLELLKTLSGTEEKVRIAVSQNQIMFQFEETVFVSRLIEGRFPNYEQVIPKEEKVTTEVNRVELLQAMKRVSLLTSQENQAVKVDFIKGKLMLAARSQNLGEAKEEIETEIKGVDLSIGFNPAYVMDALKSLDVERVRLSASDPDKPGVLRAGEHFLYVVMPMQLS